MKHKYSFLAIFVFLLQACGSGGVMVKPSTPVNDKIALCGAGFSSESLLKIQGALQQQGGTASVGFENSLRAAVFENVAKMDIKESDRAATAQSLYDKYLVCIK